MKTFKYLCLLGFNIIMIVWFFNSCSFFKPAEPDPDVYVDIIKQNVSLSTGNKTFKNTLTKYVVKDDVLNYALVASTGWDKESMLFQINYQSLSIFKSAFARTNVKEVNIIWSAEYTDKYGNVSLNTFVFVSMKEERAKKINWGNQSSLKIKEIADFYLEK
jgi:hypothetical protein